MTGRDILFRMLLKTPLEASLKSPQRALGLTRRCAERTCSNKLCVETLFWQSLFGTLKNCQYPFLILASGNIPHRVVVHLPVMHGSKSQTSLSSVIIPVQGSWNFASSATGKTQYQQQRLTRIVEGRKAVKASTEDQRAMIIGRFKEEICDTPIRQKLYREAVERAASNGSVDFGSNNPQSLGQGMGVFR